jgi:hypothetical protein
MKQSIVVSAIAAVTAATLAGCSGGNGAPSARSRSRTTFGAPTLTSNRANDFADCQTVDADWAITASALANLRSDPTAFVTDAQQLSQDLRTLALQAVAARSPDSAAFVDGAEAFTSDAELVSATGQLAHAGYAISAARIALTTDCGLPETATPPASGQTTSQQATPTAGNTGAGNTGTKNTGQTWVPGTSASNPYRDSGLCGYPEPASGLCIAGYHAHHGGCYKGAIAKYP